MHTAVFSPSNLSPVLSAFGFDPSDDLSDLEMRVLMLYLNQIATSTHWRNPHDAYRDPANHQKLLHIFPKSTSLLNAHLQDIWFDAAFDNAYQLVVQPSFPTYPTLRINWLEFFDVLNDCCAYEVDYSKEQNCSDLFVFALVYSIVSHRDTTPESAYHAYQNNQSELLPIFPFISQESFQNLTRTLTCISAVSTEEPHTLVDAENAFRIFSDASISPELQMKYCLWIHQYYLPRANTIDNPFQYIRACVENAKETFDVSPHFENEFNRAAELLAQVKASDFLEVLLYQHLSEAKRQLSDFSVESGYVFSQFLDCCQPHAAALILNPSPAFLRRCQKSYCFNSYIDVRPVFLMHWDTTARALEGEFSDIRRYQFHSSSDLTSGRILPNQYGPILAFQRSPDDNARFFFRIINEAASGTLLLMLLAESTAQELFQSLIDSSMASFVDAVDLLPMNLFSSKEKHKVLIRIVKGKADSAVSVTPCLHRSSPSCAHILFVRSEFCVPLYALLGKASIREALKDYLNASSLRKRRARPQAYSFSPELTIWYTAVQKRDMRFKVKAYLCEYPSHKQEQQNILKRGKEIKSACVWNTMCTNEAEIHHWLEDTAVFSDKIYNHAVKLLNTHYKKSPLTLKSFWYLHFQDEVLSEFNQFDICRSFIRSSAASQLLVGASVREEYEAASAAFLSSTSCCGASCNVDEAELDIWNFLSILLDIAVKERYYKANPLEDEPSPSRLRHSDFQELRDALTKKTFSISEEQIFLDTVHKELPAGPALGALIRFYTGLPAAQVCALKYRDFVSLPYTHDYQFLVYQAVSEEKPQNGTKKERTLVALRREEEYRRIPVISVLSKLILERMKSMEKSGILVENSDYFILSDFDSSSGGTASLSQPVSPASLQRYCKKLIQSIGIEDIYLEIPDEDGGAKVSNFSRYQADFFRTNVRFRLKETCGFSNSECDYFLGLQQQNTFAKHYCDFSNSLSQNVMLAKLEAWSALHRIGSSQLPYEKVFTAKDRVLEVPAMMPCCATASLTCKVAPGSKGNSSAPSEVSITIECDHGFNGMLTLTEGGSHGKQN
ncbi:hypothetical protein JQM68_11675 [Oscillibacter valericigenes]|uniref:hypothetical protein n=1 Tax=Oscillibacter valericigenes TaxID=351091 RepID=UPI001F329461|nr:hypothetical protein [Oscillibacter valericigenes]MCF2617846.1 hypothetical protein [Oscillibacter valericigenes]